MQCMQVSGAGQISRVVKGFLIFLYVFRRAGPSFAVCDEWFYVHHLFLGIVDASSDVAITITVKFYCDLQEVASGVGVQMSTKSR